MLKTIEDSLHKTCLIGLSYFNGQGEQLKQNILAGRVVKVDSDIGLTVELLSNTHNTNSTEKPAHFILPSNLAC